MHLPIASSRRAAPPPDRALHLATRVQPGRRWRAAEAHERLLVEGLRHIVSSIGKHAMLRSMFLGLMVMAFGGVHGEEAPAAYSVRITDRALGPHGEPTTSALTLLVFDWPDVTLHSWNFISTSAMTPFYPKRAETGFTVAAQTKQGPRGAWRWARYM